MPRVCQLRNRYRRRCWLSLLNFSTRVCNAHVLKTVEASLAEIFFLHVVPDNLKFGHILTIADQRKMN